MKFSRDSFLYCLCFIVCAVSAFAIAYGVIQNNRDALFLSSLEPAAGAAGTQQRVVVSFTPVNMSRKPQIFTQYEQAKIVESTVKPIPQEPKEYMRDGRRASGAVKIAVIIDDMGMDKKRGYELIKMNVPLTLAFLPYASGLEGMTQAARIGGHELMIHMPMQATDKTLNIGTIGLKEGMSEDELNMQLDRAFASFEGYVGVNNHMGSLMTQNTAAMETVMRRVKNKGLYFIDSKTISTSVAGGLAKARGVRTADRDVFLDHVESPQFVARALAQAEQVARRNGHAIVIGHPKDVTIAGLRAWLPTLADKGIEIVHASELVRTHKPEGRPPHNKVMEISTKMELDMPVSSVPLQIEAYPERITIPQSPVQPPE